DAQIPAFDELPLAYQARIHDIQSELKDGEITQKGFDKRLATIMSEYHASAASPRTKVYRTPSETDSTASTKQSAGGSTSPSQQPVVPRRSVRGPGVGARNGSKRSYYDARKSTVAGFRKPGINFDALLDDFEAGDDDYDDEYGANAPPLQSVSIPEANSRKIIDPSPKEGGSFEFSLGSPLQKAAQVPRLPSSGRAPYKNVVAHAENDDDARFDVDISSGRAYNVLHDMMDPYGAQSSSRANQDLYSDDSSNNSILGDLDALGPTEFSSGIASNGLATRSRAPSEPSLANISSEPAPSTGGTTTAAAANGLAEHLSSTAVQDASSGARVGIRNGHSSTTVANGYRPPSHEPTDRPSRVLASDGANTGFAYGVPPIASMLTPDTPTFSTFASTRFGGYSSEQTISNIMRQQPQQQLKDSADPSEEPHSGHTPISGVPVGMDGFGHASPARDERGGQLGRHHSEKSVVTDNGTASASADGTITLDDMTQASSAPAANNQYPPAAGGGNISTVVSRGSGPHEQPNTTTVSAVDGAMSMDFSYAERLASNFDDDFGLSAQSMAPSSQSGTALQPSQSAPISGTANGRSSHTPGTAMIGGSLLLDPQAMGSIHQRMSQDDSERYLRMIDASYIEDDNSYREYSISGKNSQASSKPALEAAAKDELDHNSVLDAMDYLHPHQEEARQQQAAATGRAKRRLTLGTRADRRPAGGGTNGIGRGSYYAEEAGLEIPASFDVPDTPLLGMEFASASGPPSALAPARSESKLAISRAAASARGSGDKMNNGAAPPVGDSLQREVIGISPIVTDPHMLGSDGQGMQASADGLRGDGRVSKTAPLERAVGGGAAGFASASGSASNTPPLPTAHLFAQHSAPPENLGYAYGSGDQAAQGQSAPMQQLQGGQSQPQQQQHAGQYQTGQMLGMGAIAYPRNVPDDAYSSRVQQLTTMHSNLASVLRYRASATPNEVAYTCIDTKGKEIGSWTWSGLQTRARQIVHLLQQKGVSMRGERVALVYRKYEMLDFVGSLFGCFYGGICAVPIVAGDSYAELVHVLNSTGAALVLTSDLNIKTLHKDISQNSVGPGWPTAVAWVRTDHLGGMELSAVGAQNPSSQFHARAAADGGGPSSQTDARIDSIAAEDVAYVEFSKSPNGELKGVQVTHGAIMRQCGIWMMSTGMLDVGRKYKHRVELDEDEEDAGYLQDYSLGLADTGNEYDAQSSPSTAASQLETPALPRPDSHSLSHSHSPGSAATASSPAVETEKHSSSRGSFGKKWGSSTGFLGKLRNVGSRSKMRRGSHARESVVGDIGNKLSINSTRNSLASLHVGGDMGGSRMRAASNLSTLSHQSQRLQPQPQQPSQRQARGSVALAGGAAQNGGRVRMPATEPGGFGNAAAAAKTPSANVAVFKDVVVFYIEPRQHFGLVYGVLGGCYGGHQSVYASSALCEVPGAYINLLTRYRATVAIGDYSGLHSVLSAATDDPREIAEYSKKAPPNLARLRLCLIDTLYIDPIFHETFNKNVLHPFGCPYQGIADTEGHPVVTAVCTLAEHGSALMAMRDCLSAFPPANVGADGPPSYEFVLDREAFRQNRIVVLPDARNEAELDDIGTVRYQSFGFPALHSTVAVVDPETRELCAPDAIGELWMQSQGLGTGFWGLPKLSNSIFAARFTYGAEPAGSSSAYLRTGLMGAVVRGQVLVFGFYEDRIRTLTADPPAEGAAPGWFVEPALGFHYTGDINSTIRRYLPQISECTAFELFANDTHFPVVAAEVRHNSGMYATLAEEVYGVLRNRNGLCAYAVVLCPPDTLPRAYQYGKRTVNAQLCRHQFESGLVTCLYVRLSTDRLFMNLPPPAATLPDDALVAEDPSVALYGRWVQQTSLEDGMPSIDEVSGMDLSAFCCITDILVWRAAKHPEQPAFMQFDERARPLKPLTFQKLLTKVSGAAQIMLDKRRVVAGDHVLVAISPSPSFVVAIHACLAIGAIPIPIAPPDLQRLADDLPPLLVTAREMKVAYILVDQHSDDTFKSKIMETALRVPSMRALLGSHRMPAILSLAKAPKSPKYILGRGNFRFNPQWADPSRTALLMVFTGAQASTPQYVSYSHRSMLGFCAQQKGDFQMLPNLPVIAS
ncbi:hypothetical protein EV175_003654, partial [Coemansia sp. RSA 1933]